MGIGEWGCLNCDFRLIGLMAMITGSGDHGSHDNQMNHSSDYGQDGLAPTLRIP